MKKAITKLLLALLTVVMTALSATAQEVVDVRSLLNEMVSLDAAARWPSPEYVEKQASSYDRASVSPNTAGWYANADASQYIRTDTIQDRLEHVMLDADGPGAIVRFWLTTFKRHGNLRIYLDGAPEPALLIPAYDLMKIGLPVGPVLLAPHSSYEPREKGGSTLYFPIPYARHCKITWEDKDTTNEPRYYQINYRCYSKDCRVTTVDFNHLDSLHALLAAVNDKLAHPNTLMPPGAAKAAGRIVPQGRLTLDLPAGEYAVQLLTIQLNKVSDTLINKLMISIRFDDRETVHCPLGDFAGSGQGGRPLQSWYRTVTGKGKIICRWTMPYQRKAVITLLNTANTPANVSMAAATTTWQWDDRSLYFHASWVKQNNIPVKRTEKDGPIEWTIVNLKTRGVFLGDTYCVNNGMHAWYGEGDQKFWVDHDRFPSEYGTGTEDYYNTSWAPVVIYQTPFANAPRADNADSYGYNTFTRTRNLDRVPFKTSFHYTIEMLGWQNGHIDASAVAYWYGRSLLSLQKAKSH